MPWQVLFIPGAWPLAQSPIENLPALGLALAFFGACWAAFKTRLVRWGSDVTELLAEKDKQLKERDHRIEVLEAEVTRWQAVAWQTGQAARQVATTNKDAIRLAAKLLPDGQLPDAPTPGDEPQP